MPAVIAPRDAAGHTWHYLDKQRIEITKKG